MRAAPWSIASYLIVFVCLVDQLTKHWAMSAISKYREIIYLEPWLNITLVMNKGVTFGLFDRLEHSYITYGLIAVAAIVIFFLTRWLWRTHSLIIALALGFVMGGAIGNVIDRIRYGAVVDFLDFHMGPHHWYSFNCADAAIVTGVTMLLLDSLVRGR